MLIPSFLNKVKANITENMNNKLRNSINEEGTFSDWDAEMRINWHNLINPPLMYPKANKKERLN